MIETLARGVVAPAVIAFATAYLAWRFGPKKIRGRYAFPLAMAAGFIAGYALLPDWAEWIPTRHWQWLVYLAMIAAVVGPVSCARGVFPWERGLLYLLLTVAAACLLVPDWESLEAIRYRYIGFVSAYLFGLAAGLAPLADRVSSRLLAIAWTTSAMFLAAVILVAVSARHAQVTGLAAAALAGCGLHVLLFAGSASVRSLAPLYAVLVGGWAFVGNIEPEPPLTGLLVLPAAPLALWVGKLLPFPPDTWRSTIVALVAVAMVLGMGVAWTLFTSS